LSIRAGGWDILGRAIGLPADALISALGEPVARRLTGDALWLVFEGLGRRLRVRCDAAREGAEVASWTLSFDAGPATLREAAEPLGLWPQAVPDIAAELSEGSPILRAVAGAAEGRVHSLTVSAKGGRIHKVTLFDEPPEWL
jgi:hypothetical protein